MSQDNLTLNKESSSNSSGLIDSAPVYVSEESSEIILGDCLEIMRSWPDSFVHGIITSPPFRDADIPGDYYEWFVKFVSECQRVSRDYALIFNSSRRLKQIDRLTDPIRHIIWDKQQGRTPYRFEPIFVYSGLNPEFNFNAVCWTDCIPCQPLLRFPSFSNKIGSDAHNFDLNTNNNQSSFTVIEGRHPYENPLKLYKILARFLRKGGSEIICDPCLGSGTTLVACEQLGLKGIGIEISKEYAELARKRVSEYVGQRRLLEGISSE